MIDLCTITWERICRKSGKYDPRLSRAGEVYRGCPN